MNHFSLELIDYQNKDQYPKKLTELIEKIYQEIDDKTFKNNKELLTNSDTAKSITNLIKDRFNLNVVFDPEFSEYYMAAIIPFMSDYLSSSSSTNKITLKKITEILSGINIFKHYKKLEKEKENYYKKIHDKKGYVDKKNARVGGYLSEVKNYLLINFFVLKQYDITPIEVAGIVTHELGHSFTGLETHHRLTTTNSTIADILEDINNNKKSKAMYTFKKHFDYKDIEKASLDSNEEIVDFYGKLAKVYVGELNSQLMNNKYDETNFENLADSFAVRFNLGEALVTGLNKLHLSSGSLAKKNSLGVWSFVIIDFIVYSLYFYFYGLAGVALISLIFLALANIPKGDMTYDDPLDRYNRIRNGIINNLKNKKIPTIIAENLLEQLEMIDSIVKNHAELYSVIQNVFGFFDIINKNDKHYIELQQTIENSLNNHLFKSYWDVKLKT